MSQRADYINNDLFEWVQFNRAIINTRDEPLADARKYRRLHLLHGDTNVLPASLLLKVGTTSLVLDLLELNCLPKIVLADAVAAFRNLSHHPDGPWLVPLADGRCADAIELLFQYLQAARAALARARHGNGPAALGMGGGTQRAGDGPRSAGGPGGLDHQALAVAAILPAGEDWLEPSLA